MDCPPFNSSLVDGCRALTCLPFHQGPLSGFGAVRPAGDPLMANETGPSSHRLGAWAWQPREFANPRRYASALQY